MLDAIAEAQARHPTGDPGDAVAFELGEAAEAALDLEEQVRRVVGRLREEADRRVTRRAPVEQRWLQDLRQYHGLYDPTIAERIKAQGGSEANINLTAVKTDALTARLFDLLFPTDDRNWSLGPTPVPELDREASAWLEEVEAARAEADAAERRMRAAEAAEAMGQARDAEAQMREAEDREGLARAEADRLSARQGEAKRRAELMQSEIDDNLAECAYAAEARDAIEDACKLGMGALKGPVRSRSRARRWADDGSGQFVLADETSDAPAAYRVDPWGYFPDPDCARVRDGQGDFERHLLNGKQLRALARDADMDADAIRRLLVAGPGKDGLPSYVAELHGLGAESASGLGDRYVVWEFTGPLDRDEMAALERARPTLDPETGLPLPSALGEADPLVEVQARVWFCGDEVLSFAPHPLDSGDGLYSVMTIRPDEASPFGHGVPSIVRSPQTVINSAWRMMLDNAGAAAGPQVVINREAIAPQDGSWRLRPFKEWLLDPSKQATNGDPFNVYDIRSNQSDFAAVITMATEVLEEMAAIPAIAQGEAGAQVTQTFQGMALLMTAANILFKRLVKRWDDDVTQPLIGRFYDWHMQFSPRAEIKGDLRVHARGSDALLARELMANNLLALQRLYPDDPWFKQEELRRLILRAHMIPAEDVMRTAQEHREFLREQAENPSPEAAAQMALAEIEREKLALERERLEAQMALAEMETASRERVAQLNHDAAMERAALAANESADERAARLAAKDAELGHKERVVAAEVGMARETGQSAGGHV